ncbi:MAG: lysylphosphatidylglycerol synthase transmembrane domain-containing protein [bacterium]|nr:lysylphosphatidylglycerol synthase transmembrane domain-containing protein [bacterium]
MKKKALSVIITTIILGLIFWYLSANREIFTSLSNIKPIYLIPAFLLQITIIYVNGRYIKALARPFNIDLKEHFALSIAASFFNLITPFRGGAGLRAIYMKKKHKLNYSHFLASLFGNYMIIFQVASILGILTFLFVPMHPPILIAFAILFIVTTILIIFPRPFKTKNILTIKINKVLEGWKMIKDHPKLLSKLILYTITNLLLGSMINLVIFMGLGLEITFFKAFYLSIITVLAIFINITPGSVGITEGFYMISSNVIGITPGLSLVIALTIRAINTITLITLGPICAAKLKKSISK